MKRQTRQKTAAMILMLGMILTGQSILAEEKEGFRLQYKAGDGLKMGDGNNLVHLQGRVQGRFTYNGLEAAADNDSFAVQRGKIKIEGHTLEKKLKFGFQMNLATRARATTATVCTDGTGADVDATGECTQANSSAVTAESTTGLATLEDYYIDWVPVSWFGVKLGQFKVPFLMQELTSSGKQQFVDRSLSTGFFNLGRDLGVTIHGKIGERGLLYDLFAMNGDGINQVNRNQSLMLGSRVEYPILGTYVASESDTDHSEDPNLGIGAALAYNELGSAIQGGTIAAGIKTLNGTLDLGYKYKGWSLQGAGMVTRALDTAKLTNWGYNGQVGWFFVPKKLEVAGRAGTTVFSNATANQHEYAVALNYFVAGHGIKLQTDYALVMNSRGLNLNDHRFRTQMQVIF